MPQVVRIIAETKGIAYEDVTKGDIGSYVAVPRGECVRTSKFWVQLRLVRLRLTLRF